MLSRKHIQGSRPQNIPCHIYIISQNLHGSLQSKAQGNTVEYTCLFDTHTHKQTSSTAGINDHQSTIINHHKSSSTNINQQQPQQPQPREPQLREPQLWEPQLREPQLREPQLGEPQLRQPQLWQPQAQLRQPQPPPPTPPPPSPPPSQQQQQQQGQPPQDLGRNQWGRRIQIPTMMALRSQITTKKSCNSCPGVCLALFIYRLGPVMDYNAMTTLSFPHLIIQQGQ